MTTLILTAISIVVIFAFRLDFVSRIYMQEAQREYDRCKTQEELFKKFLELHENEKSVFMDALNLTKWTRRQFFGGPQQC